MDEMTYDEVMADAAFDELCYEEEKVANALEKLGYKRIKGDIKVKFR